MQTEGFHVVHARAAGLDVHKMEITATVRLCDGGGEPETETRCFGTLPSGLAEMAAWLAGHGVEAAVMEGTGVCRQAPFAALDRAEINAILVHARQGRQLTCGSPPLRRRCPQGGASPSPWRYTAVSKDPVPGPNRGRCRRLPSPFGPRSPSGIAQEPARASRRLGFPFVARRRPVGRADSRPQVLLERRLALQMPGHPFQMAGVVGRDAQLRPAPHEIGRASCRERV